MGGGLGICPSCGLVHLSAISTQGEFSSAGEEFPPAREAPVAAPVSTRPAIPFPAIKVSHMITETWRIIAAIGAVVFIFSAILPLISIQFIGTFSISLLDLYSAIGHWGATSTPEIPSELTGPSGIGLLMTIILFPITAIIGFIAAATSRKLAFAAGILGIICWSGSVWTILEIKSFTPSFAATMIQFGNGIIVGIFGALIMLVSCFVRPVSTQGKSSPAIASPHPSEAPATAPILTPLAIPPIKASHIKRNIIIVVMLVLLVGVAAVALSTLGPETGTKTTTTPPQQQGNVIRIGQPFILKEGAEKIPVEITFASAWFTEAYEYNKAEKGYKFLVLEIQAKNLGMKKTDCFNTTRWEVTVDKGYIYDGYCDLFLVTVRPGETKTGSVFFEILATTSPLEVRYYSSYFGDDPTLVLDVRGETITTTTTTTASEAQLEILMISRESFGEKDMGWLREPLGLF